MNSHKDPNMLVDGHEIKEASALLKEGKLTDAELLLRDYVRRMPKDWKPVMEEPDKLIGFFWSLTEFLAFVAAKRRENSVTWAAGSYTEAYYMLAFIAGERHDWSEVVKEAENGLALEPDQPDLLCEKALALGFLGRVREAIELYRKASTVREWATRPQLAKALRGAGTLLIDLGNLDEAERLLRESLQHEPENPGTKRELNYIAMLRNGGPQSPRVLTRGTSQLAR